MCVLKEVSGNLGSASLKVLFDMMIGQIKMEDESCMRFAELCLKDV